MFRFGIRNMIIPHHPIAHDAMIGVTGAQGLIAIVDARIGGERPRPEIQPLESAKPTASGSCGSTWRDPHIRRG